MKKTNKKQVVEILGVHTKSLSRWDDKCLGEIFKVKDIKNLKMYIKRKVQGIEKKELKSLAKRYAKKNYP